MNKNKFYTIGLIAGSLFATSCDDRVDCGCDCNMPVFEKWEVLNPNETKNEDGTVSSGKAIVVWGKNLSDITEISFGGMNAELQPAFMEDNKIIFQIPSGIPEDCVAHVRTSYCEQGFFADLLKVVVAPPCVAMCDNEMAEKTLKIYGSNLFAPLTAKFWDGKDYTLVASTEDGTITTEGVEGNRATITIPKGVKDGGKIKFVTKAGEGESDFIFRDTRNMLITHDDEEYLNLFNSQKPDMNLENKESLKELFHKSGNNTTEFSIFHDIAGYTAWTYYPWDKESNPSEVEPKTPTPFGCFSNSINEGKTSISDYVIKFEVFVPKSNPIQGNGLAIAFFGAAWQDIRSYCAFWQPSEAQFAKDDKGIWQQSATFKEWHTNDDWVTVTIPFDEIRHDFASKNYYCSCQNNREILDGSEKKYAAFGDKDNGLDFFSLNDFSHSLLDWDESMDIQGIGIEFGNADQPNATNEPLIGVDNLRITPKDNNGAIYPLFNWGQPSRDFFTKPSTACK